MAETSKIWTPEIADEMTSMYLERMEELDEDVRGKFSPEIVADIASQFGFTTNSFRAKLVKAGVYVKATQAKKETKSATGSTSTRKSKEDSHKELVSAFSDAGITEELDLEIVSKLTGKAALHLAELVRKLTK